MGLSLKSFQQIMQGMADWIITHSNRLVDFSTGSILRSLLEAVATEIEEFYFRTYANFNWAVENSLYESFSFSRREAVPAYGELVIKFNIPLQTNLQIPAGTRFATRYEINNKQIVFETTEMYIVPEGTSETTITVTCTEAGTIGNVNKDTITVMLNPISNVSTVTNPQRFLTGREAETLAERKQRFAQYVSTRARGTKASILYGTLEIPQVTGAYVDDSQIGIVLVYCHDGNGNLPDNVKEAVEENLENYRAAGIPVLVMPVVKVTPNIVIDLYVDGQYNNSSYADYIQQQVEDYLDNFVIAKDLFRSDLNNFIRNLDPVGIKNCIIQTPDQDIAVANSELIRSGTVTINLITSNE